MKANEAEAILLAMAGAYVWVASADELADLDEYNKFTHVILESPFATHFSEEDLRHTYRDLVSLFQDQYEYAMQLTLERIKAVKAQPMAAEEVLRLARAALVADGKLDNSEENVLKLVEDELKA